MNTCKTCKHYQPKPDNLSGDCGSENWIKSYNASFNENCFSRVRPNQVLVEIDEGWGFEVGPDFGCVHHESE